MSTYSDEFRQQMKERLTDSYYEYMEGAEDQLVVDVGACRLMEDLRSITEAEVQALSKKLKSCQVLLEMIHRALGY